MIVLRPIPTLSVLLLALTSCGADASSQPNQDPNLFVVKKDDLPISVRENAELQALRETIVRSEVEGQSTIIYIVPEGTIVKQGERLVELDVSELVEKASTQEISVEKAKSAVEQARTQQNILEKELTTKRNTASSQLTIAHMELEKLLGAKGGSGSEGKNSDMVKRLRELVSDPVESEAPAAAPGDDTTQTAALAELFTRVKPTNYVGLVDKVLKLLEIRTEAGVVDAYDRDMGEMSNKILQQADKIRLATAELKNSEDTYGYSKRLYGKKFITRDALEKDKLNYQRQASAVTLSWNDLELLINYTLAKDRIKMKQDFENATLELERVTASNDAERKKSEFDVDAKAKEFKLASERLDNLKRQIKSAVVYAPTPGTVVYARLDRNRGGGEAVREGVQVRERQELIILPDTTKMRCIIKVQEAQVDKVARGLPAFVTIDMIQETFTGRVTSVAPVADSNSGWMTSDRKVYTTNVELDSDNPDGRLRSRMAANVTIMVDTIKDTLPVPLQAVLRDRSVNYVWRQEVDGPHAVQVKVGRQNTERVEILTGIQAGDVLHLTVPAGVPTPKFEQPVAPEPAPMKTEAKPDATAGGDGSKPARGNRGMGNMNQKLADMTPEDLESYKGRLDGMQRMIDGARQGANLEVANEIEATVAALRQALEKNDLVAGQTHKDKLSTLMKKMSGGRQGPGGGGPGGGNGDGGDRPRRGGGGNGGGGGGGGGNGAGGGGESAGGGRTDRGN